jgi:hypothetical protein
MITEVEFPAIRRHELDADDILPCGAESAFVVLCRTGILSNRTGYFCVQCKIEFWTLRISILPIYLWSYSPSRVLASLIRCLHSSLFAALFVYLLIPSEASLRFSDHRFISGVGSSPPRPTPKLEDQGDPASSYATAGWALRIIWPHKPHNYVKVETPSGGCISVTKLKIQLHHIKDLNTK